jgi:HTH-type transcriptional regulator, competence development regulator
MFPERLERLRKEKKLSQQYMGNLLGITRQAYAKYEKGDSEPDISTINKLATFFNVTADFLLGNTNNPNDTADQSKLYKHEQTYDSLAEITKLAKKYGLEQLGFFDIKEWENLSPEEIKMLDAQFKAVANMAKKRNEEK